MKKTFVKFAALAAVCVLGFASCEIAEPENPVSGNDAVEAEGNFSVTFNCVLDDPDDATKTEYHDKTIWWSAGDKVRFMQYACVGGEMTYKSTSTTLSKASESFSLTVGSFNTPDEGTDSYYMAVFPMNTLYNTSSGSIRVEVALPGAQKPSASSFDPAADLLISQYQENLEKNAEGKYSVKLKFKRMVSLAKMTLKGLPSTSKVELIKFSAKSGGAACSLAGERWFGFLEGAQTSVASNVAAITLDCSEFDFYASGTGQTAYFNCYPFSLGEGDSFTVEVTTADGEVFIREVTIPSGKSLEFVAGNGTVFSVDMSETVPVQTCDWFTILNYTSGDYTPKYNSIYFRLASTATNWVSGKYCAVTESEYTSGLSDLDALIETKGTAISSSVITGINGGSAYRLNVTNLDFNTPYFILVKSVLDDSSTGIATLQSATAVFDVRAAAVTTAGKANFYFYGTNLASMKYKFVPSANLTGVTDYSAYFDTLTGLSTATATRIENINTKGTDSASMTGLTSGAKYRFMAKAIDNDGNVHFAYSSEITVN